MSDRYTQNRGKLPASYVTFIEECGAWEGDLGDYYGYIVLWRMEEIQEQWIAYEMEKYLPAYWFAIGTNGGPSPRGRPSPRGQAVTCYFLPDTRIRFRIAL